MASSEQAADKGKYVGVKGWLLVLVIVLGIGLVFNVVGFFSNMQTLSDRDAQIGFSIYPELKTVLYFEIAVLLAAIVGAALAAGMIFKRMKVAKTVITTLLVGVVVAGIIDTVWISDILADNPQALAAVDTSKDLTRAVIGALIWVPYLYMSKRVKQTLTR